ncbi:hypothetical protein DET1243 [Dehalococcoides mccartyi 195]|uniref:Uncharacterized protein n=1 Tax=Dehalococcoides mccartyi (strain ATCC BAA-2266 / KCTC 15142 / 195) TaxID=243164 RepID=Q3Z744_DEHM1|nr:hypothetical protein DET1243 [Dehalococcoides mccartyi 195]
MLLYTFSIISRRTKHNTFLLKKLTGLTYPSTAP